MEIGRDLLKGNNVVVVIGNESMTKEQAYKAMNNLGYLESNMIIIINDNEHVSLTTTTLDRRPFIDGNFKALSKEDA